MPKGSEHHTPEIHYVKGYPSLAAFIASDSDKTTAIYRRFDRLSARNLLYLQSELVELEARQDALDAEDLRTTLEDKKSVRNWQTLKSRAIEPGNTREKERLSVSEEIRRKIKEYSRISYVPFHEADSFTRSATGSQVIEESLMLESALLTLKKPQTRTLTAFRNIFNNLDESGYGYPTLGGRSANILNDANDLVALRTRDEEDRLTSFLRYSVPLLFVVSTSSPSSSNDSLIVDRHKEPTAGLHTSPSVAYALLSPFSMFS